MVVDHVLSLVFTIDRFLGYSRADCPPYFSDGREKLSAYLYLGEVEEALYSLCGKRTGMHVGSALNP